MARNMCAVVRMEEMYLRLTIEYDNDISRKQIADAILKIEKEDKEHIGKIAICSVRNRKNTNADQNNNL